MSKDIYVTPKVVTNMAECYFHHKIDIPGHGLVDGMWDIRHDTKKYLGDVDFKGKRVLEVGPGGGFLTFYMERQGAEVVSCDLSGEEFIGDIPPFSNDKYEDLVRGRKAHIKKLHNAYWFSHRAHNSKARVVYGDVYNIPEEIGMFDISTICSVLLHVRDPFLAMQTAAKFAKQTMIIQDVLSKRFYFQSIINKFRGRPFIESMVYSNDTWWILNPDIVKHYLKALGFKDTKVNYHYGIQYGEKIPLFTVVGRR